MTSIQNRIIVSILSCVALFLAALALARHGEYGWTLFVCLPVAAGALSVWSYQPRSTGRAVGISALVGAMGCLLFFLIGREGYICVAMALPVATPVAIAGGLLAYWGGKRFSARRHAAICLLIPLSMSYDVTAKPPVYAVTTQIVINATPQQVWKYVVAFADIPSQPDWLLRTGLAYPIRTEIDGAGVGVPRECVLSTGIVKERVTVWDEPRLLRFDVTETPPAMRESGLYGAIIPKHLSGYYISKAGQFTLTALPGGRTLLVGTSWYQHGLWPAEYWRLWSDTIVHHIHRRVLEHIRNLAEANG